ncbi:TetR/AcrR family transcriptional regulator [Streptomyces hokutonensis]|uniref:TetR/AcrR family transcriptional regulator n=1 Tax=Streptomyces hokutonensis TaxID=1306990 RepID=A0ABW6M7B4_9ACTN
MRSDARANRTRILEAAMEAFAADDEPSLGSIARRAGVGKGTLYRHFPSRESLVLQMYAYEVWQLTSCVSDLLANRPPFEALREWLTRLAHCGAGRAGLADALDGAVTQTVVVAETYGPVVDALTALLRANEEAGTVVSGLYADDVLLILGCLWRAGPDAEGRDRADRMLDVVLRGLGARPAAESRQTGP